MKKYFFCVIICENEVFMIDFVLNYQGVDLVIAVASYFIALLFAFSLHEYAHARVAYNQGDYTPKAKGRLTLNPFKHIDPLGFICLILVGFGWAKPVEVNPIQFKEYRKGFFLVSIAGILTNFVLAFFSCGLYIATMRIFGMIAEPSTFVTYLFTFLAILFLYSTRINLCLGIFNLLPIYPLDGFNIINSFTNQGNKFVNFMSKYGNLILILLVIVDAVLDSVIGVGIFSFAVNFCMFPLINFWGLLL